MAEKKTSGRLRTPEEIKKELARRGETIADLARRHGLNPKSVYDVMAGRIKGTYGESHRIAVLLRLKDGTVGDESCGGKRTKRKEAAA